MTPSVCVYFFIFWFFGMDKIHIKVQLFSPTSRYYCLLYKKKSSAMFGLISCESWERITYTWYIGDDYAHIDRSQPLLFVDFDEAVAKAKLLSDPKQFNQFVTEQDKIYTEAKQKRKEILNKRNKVFEI